jgi:predicted ATPase
LVLDNFEHLTTATPFLVALMAEAPFLKLLVTSRQRLRLRGEQIFWIQGLELPGTDAPVESARSAAVRLFEQTARRSNPAFVLDENKAAYVARICRLLEGMPLAIELVASWAGVLSPAAMEREVRRGLDIMTGELRDIPRRHRSMEATLDVSWRRLEAEKREVFQRLSVFRGGLTREAAREVAGATLPTLAVLLNASWLTYDEKRDRYFVHELLRQYAAAKARKKPTVEQEVRDGHAAYYMDYMRQRDEGWHHEGQRRQLEEVGYDIGNVRIAWRHAVDTDQSPLLDEGLYSLCVYYERRGYEAEARELLLQARDTLLSSSRTCEDDAARRRLLARIYGWQSRFATSAEEAKGMLDEGAGLIAGLLAQDIDVRREEAFLMLRKGETTIRTDPRIARRCLQRALSLYEDLGDVVGRALATTAQGQLEWHLGNYEDAADLLRRALAAHEGLGNDGGIAKALELLGLIEKHQGRLKNAQRIQRQSYELFRELGDRVGMVGVAGRLASNLTWSGDFEEAYAVAEEGLRLAEDVGAPGKTSYLVAVLAWIGIHRGEYEEARRRAEHAVALAHAAGAGLTRGWSTVYLGMLDLVAGESERAVARLEQGATTLAQYRKSLWMLPQLFEVLALARLGQWERAQRLLDAALHMNMKSRVFLVAVTVLPAAARLAAGRGEVERAIELYALAEQYPYVSTSWWFRDMVGEEAKGWLNLLQPDVADAARERGRAHTLWGVVGDLLPL